MQRNESSQNRDILFTKSLSVVSISKELIELQKSVFEDRRILLNLVNRISFLENQYKNIGKPEKTEL
jgi:hypothetical protein